MDINRREELEIKVYGTETNDVSHYVPCENQVKN